LQDLIENNLYLDFNRFSNLYDGHGCALTLVLRRMTNSSRQDPPITDVEAAIHALMELPEEAFQKKAAQEKRHKYIFK
jgi:hypothetical protein